MNDVTVFGLQPSPFVRTVLLSLVGGGVGMVLGTGAALALGAVPAPDLVPLPILKTDILWIALGVMLFTALTSGLIPAWRATRVDPALTLRFE